MEKYIKKRDILYINIDVYFHVENSLNPQDIYLELVFPLNVCV